MVLPLLCLSPQSPSLWPWELDYPGGHGGHRGPERPGFTEGQGLLNPGEARSLQDPARPSHSSAAVPPCPRLKPPRPPLTSQTRPRAMTTMWWAPRTVLSRWAMTSTVRPVLARSRASCTTRSDSASRALVASSRTSTAGCLMSARAMARRCFWPPDRVAPRSPGEERDRAGA